MRRSLITIAALSASLIAASSAEAQRGPQRGDAAGRPRPTQEQRAAMRDKLKNMTPEERKAALDKAKDRREERRDERLENRTPEQKAWAQAMAAHMKTTRDGVKAGTLTRETAAAQLKAWRESNPRPTGTK